jgi:hypothetical protein
MLPGLGGPLGAALAVAVVMLFVLPWMRERSILRHPPSPLLQGRPIPTYRAALPELRRELERVRRHEHPLSVVVLKPSEGTGFLQPVAGPSNGSELPAGYAEYQKFLEVGMILGESLRAGDLLAADPVGRRYVLVLPELDREDASRTVARLDELVLRGTGATLRTGFAEFWRDALTVDDLVETADMRLRSKAADPSGAALSALRDRQARSG